MTKQELIDKATKEYPILKDYMFTIKDSLFFICVLIIFGVFGYLIGYYKCYYKTTEFTYENCKEVVIDTISYNCENSTYTFKISRKYDTKRNNGIDKK